MNGRPENRETEIDRRRFLALVTAGLAMVQKSTAAASKGHLIDAGPGHTTSDISHLQLKSAQSVYELH
jgi:hypothetical protein